MIISREINLVETIICFLPHDRSLGCYCSFLLKLLKVAVLVEADDLSREELVSKISVKLDQASLKDLLIPARPPQTTVHDVELVLSIVKRFVKLEKSRLDVNFLNNDKGEQEFGVEHGYWLNIGSLVDAYLAVIASYPNLIPSNFVELGKLIPESARPIHDGLYRAVDKYLKVHSDFTKAEKKQICRLMDVKKLTTDASMHAAQNERLPLRVVVQVLYFEQMRSASTTQTLTGTSNNSPSTPNVEEWDQKTLESFKSLEKKWTK